MTTLLIPVVASLVLPTSLDGLRAVVWLVALIPVFPWAIRSGWPGVLTSVAIGSGTWAATLLAAGAMGRPLPELVLWVFIAYLAISGAAGRMANLLHREQASIQNLALTDNLTRLPNRRHVEEFLQSEFAAARRGHPLCAVLFDLDGFKAFNDLHGHRAGDRALERFGEILGATTRRMNISGRFGGEEFLSVLSGSDEAGAVVFADRVREALESVRLSQSLLTVSAGVAGYHPSMATPDELIAAADLALYRAKRDGRNCVRVFGHHDEDAQAIARVTEGDAASEGPFASPEVGEGQSVQPALLEAAKSIARAIERRDSEKGGHAARVARYSDMLARAAGMMSSVNAETLRLACLLHDVGEIGVPREILEKPGALTPEELSLVQQHTLVGHRILESLISDQDVLAVARSHHERWDGSGYPDGLHGEAIPTAARIVAIADALDAMTSPRAYREALPWQVAVDEISELGGSQFDPVLIDRFRAALPELENLGKTTEDSESDG